MLNSKNAVIHFALFFRPWVVSAQAVSPPKSFIEFVDLFGLIGDVANNNLQVSRLIFLFISKTRKSSVQSVNVKHVFFSSKLVKVIGFHDTFFRGAGGGGGGGGWGGGEATP